MIKKDSKKKTVLSLFSGCGGLDLGILGGFNFLGKNYGKHNFDIVWANDIDASACKTYQKNLGHDIVCGDIRELIKEDVSSPIPETVDVVLGGFPCQDFSHAGKRLGFDSERGTLYQSMGQIIKKTRPALFMAENVKGLLTMDNGDAIKQITTDFEKLGYFVNYKLFNTADFGVPQKRERVVVIGTRKDLLPKFEFPTPHLNKDNRVNLGVAIGDLENLEEGALSNHYWSKAKKNNGQGNSTVSKDDSGPTMRAEHHGNIEFHWNEKRRLSAREAARIQSFPDDFIFYPSTSSAYKQIGNAVPPVFGWHLANAIQTFLDSSLS